MIEPGQTLETQQVATTPKGSALPFEPYRELGQEELVERIRAARETLGGDLVILGHHYQQDEVIQFADLTGDSYKLSSLAAQREDCRYIIFCGVHFMAETADILVNAPERRTARLQKYGPEREWVDVVLPDMAAGCSMADMADIDQVEACWDALNEVYDAESEVLPVTYINSAANLKAFCARHGGLVCTSSNARAALEWAFARRPRVLFFPDQHLGRNTARAMGIPLEEMIVWNPYEDLGGNSPEDIQRARVILWQGHCSVHQMFRPEHVDLFRQKFPGIRILVHPECRMEVVEKADLVGSTEFIIRTIREAEPGSRWAIGTELHLVNRLKHQHPDKEIYFLSPMVCMCATMYRIDLPHLCWAIENLVHGTPVNVIRVPEETAHWARLALERMLSVR